MANQQHHNNTGTDGKTGSTVKKTGRPIDPHDRFEWWATVRMPINVRGHLRLSRTHDTPSIEQVAELANRLDEAGTGIALRRTIDELLISATTFEDRTDLWAHIRTLELLSKTTFAAMDRPGWKPPTTGPRRPLRPSELGVVRLASLTKVSEHERSVDAQRATLACLEAGAVAGELGLIHTQDILLNEAGVPQQIQLAGTDRSVASGFPIAYPRVAEIPKWAVGSFARVLRWHTGNRPLLATLTQQHDNAAALESALLMRVRKQLHKAGLKGDATVKPGSIRNGAARLIYEESGIEAAARFLGHRSLDFVMEEISAAW